MIALILVIFLPVAMSEAQTKASPSKPVASQGTSAQEDKAIEQHLS